eukprot:403349450
MYQLKILIFFILSIQLSSYAQQQDYVKRNEPDQGIGFGKNMFGSDMVILNAHLNGTIQVQDMWSEDYEVPNYDRQWHGYVLTFSWNILAFIMIVSNRYIKYFNHNNYALHVFCGTLIGAFTMFYAGFGWRKSNWKINYKDKHHLFGVATLFLSMLLIFLGKKTRDRMFAMKRNHKEIIKMKQQHANLAYLVLFVSQGAILSGIYKGLMIYGLDWYICKINKGEIPSTDSIKTSLTIDDYYEKVNKGEQLMLLDDVVLDVRKYKLDHPGGQFLMQSNIGQDISKYFYGGFTFENYIPDKMGYIHLTIKNYSLGLSSQIHNSDSDTDTYNIRGPYGLGLIFNVKWQDQHSCIPDCNNKLEGTYLLFIGGTGILPFLDLIGYLLRLVLNLINNPNEIFINLQNFKLILHMSQNERKHYIGKDLIEGFSQLCKQRNINNFQLTMRNQRESHWEREYLENQIKTVRSENIKELKQIFVCGPPKMNESFLLFFNQIKKKMSIKDQQFHIL